MSVIINLIKSCLPGSLLGWTISLFLIYAVYRWNKFKNQFSTIPRLPTVPIFGHLFDFVGNPLKPDGLQLFERTHRMLLRACNVYAKEGVAIFWVFFKPIVIIFTPNHVEKLLTSNVEITKGHDYDYIRPWLFDGLLVSTGKRWKARRRIISPAFHFSIINDFIPTFVECGDRLCNRLVQIQNESPKAHIEDLMTIVEQFALEVICQTSIGVSLNSIVKGENGRTALNYPHSLALITHGAFERSVNAFLASDFIFYQTKTGKDFAQNIDLVKSFLNSVVKERIQQRSKEMETKQTKNEIENQENIYFYGKSKKKRAFLDLLVDTMLEQQKSSEPVPEEQKLDFNGIIEEVNTFTFAGYDTTSSTLLSTLYLLGLHPEFQQKAYEEVVEVLGHNFNANETIDTESVSKLKYVEACIKEAIRLLPTVPIISRNLKNEFVLSNGIRLPAHSQVFICFLGLHALKESFDSPSEYRPERFYLNDVDSKSPFAFVPFSAGPRNCIGQRFALNDLKIVVSMFVQRFQFESLLPLNQFKQRIEVVAKPGVKVPIKLILRKF